MQPDGSVIIASEIDVRGVEDGLGKIKNMLGKDFGAETAFAHLQKSIDSNKKALVDMQNTQAKTNASLDEARQKTLDYASSLDTAKNNALKNAEALASAKSKMEESDKVLQNQKNILAESSENTKKLKAAYDELRISSEANTEEVKKAKAAYEESKQVKAENGKVVKELRAEYNALNQEFKTQKAIAKEADKEVTSLNKQYEESEAAAKLLATSLDLSNKEIEEQEQKIKSLSAEWKATVAQLIDASNELENSSKRLGAIGDSMSDVGKKMSAYITAPVVALGVGASKSAIDFESAFAGIRKTVDATEEEFAALEAGVREMALSLPATAVDIAAVGEAAGQLGIAKENILDFTQTMIDLGESTNLSADQAATSFARFANIMQMPQDSFDRLGSVVVSLGNSLATTESEIVEMGMRIAGAGKQVGMTEAQVMSFSGALSSVGIEAEMGGSAFSKLLINMQLAAQNGSRANEILSKTGMTLRELQMYADASGSDFKWLAQELGYTSAEFKNFLSNALDLENFSKVIGITADEFKNLAASDPTKAITMFLEGLKRMGVEGESVIVTLDEMGITETRLRDAILRAASASDVFNEALSTGQTAWEENTALSDEASKRYETMASRIQMAKNALNEIGIQVGEILMPHIEKLIGGIGDLVTKFNSLDEGTKEALVTTLGITAAIGPLLIVGGNALKLIATMQGTMALLKLAQAAVAAGTTTTTTAFVAQGIAAGTTTPLLGGLALGLGGVATAAKAAAVSIAAIPGFGWIAAAVTLVTGAIVGLTVAHNNHKKALEEERQALINSGEKLKQYGNDLDNATSKFKNINNLVAQYKELKKATEDVTLSSSEKLALDTKLASVTEQLISQSDGIITAYDAENGLIELRLPMLERSLELEQKLAKLRLEEAMAGKSEKDYNDEIDSLRNKETALQNLIRAYEDGKTAAELLKTASTETSAEQQKNSENLRETVRNSKETILESLYVLKDLKGITEEASRGYMNLTLELDGNGIAAKTNQKYIAELNEKLSETSIELNTTEQSLTQLQITSDKLSKLELQTTFEDLSAQLKNGTITQEQYTNKLEELGITITKVDDIVKENAGTVNDNTGAIEENTNSTEKSATAYDTLLDSISNVVKESSKLQSAYQSLQKGEALSADTLLDLIDKYPKVAKHIADTNDLTLDKGRILQEVLAEEKKHTNDRYIEEEKRLTEAKAAALARIELIKIEYEARARLFGVDSETAKRWKETNKEAVAEERAAIKAWEDQLELLKSRMAAANSVELTYTETKGKSAAATQKLTQATEEHIKAVEESLDLIKTEYGTHYDEMTAEQLDFEKESIKKQKEAAEEKEKINKIALKRMEIDSAESDDARLKAQQEYNQLVLDYQNDLINKQISAREETLKEEQKLINETGEAIIEALKERYNQQEELEQYALDKSLKAVKANTDEKIKEYQREYDEKIKLIDEASQAEIDALQAQIDALTEEDPSDKAYENVQKLIELNQAVVKAQMGDGDLAKAQEAYDKEVKRQQDARAAAEKKAQIEILQAQKKGAEDAAKQKEQLMKEAQEAAEKYREEEIAYHQEVANMEVKIAGTKNEQLKKLLQEDLDEYKRVHAEKAALVKGDTAYLQFDKTIEQLEKQLSEAKTDADKARIKKQLDEIRNFENEFFNNVTLMDQQAQDLISQAQKEIHLNKMLALDKLHYDEMNEAAKLQAEAQRLSLGENQQALLDLLAEFNPDWENQGKTFFDKMGLGMESGFETLLEKVQGYMKTLQDLTAQGVDLEAGVDAFGKTDAELEKERKDKIYQQTSGVGKALKEAQSAETTSIAQASAAVGAGSIVNNAKTVNIEQNNEFYVEPKDPSDLRRALEETSIGVANVVS